jgi:hypothetical protein
MLEVRKPFLPSPFEDEDSREIKENEEEEEKPVEQPQQQNSEETHGGSESTESIEDSENPAEADESEQQSSSKSESSSSGSQTQEAKEEAVSEESENPVDENNSSDSHEEDSDDSMQGDIDSNDEKNGEGNSEVSEHEDMDSGNLEADNDNIDSNEESEEDSEMKAEEDIGSVQDSNEGMNEDMGSDDVQDNENNEDDFVENDSEDSEDQDEQAYNYNTEEIVTIKTNEKLLVKYFATEFWRFIESFAEEKTKIYDNAEPEEYNVKKLMFRAYERKPLSAYMQKRVRETVVLILDNSGSMSWWASNLKMLASLALEKRDVEVYIAPNGEIVAQLTKNARVQVSHGKFMKAMNGRKVIYVGDFDGGDTPIKLSWSNDVIWICPEDRYRHFLSHNWVHYDESRFHGVFIRAFTLEEMFKGLRRITRLNRLFIDLHEDERFSDD